MSYIKRILSPKAKEYITIFPVVGITGPRQAGKSTLLKHLFGTEYRYLTFDDSDLVQQFHDDPKAFMAMYNNRVIFDEVQKVPEIFNYIKIAVDNDRENYGKFILTGSSQFSMLKSITESLAGRIGLLTLLPFQYFEIPEELRDAAVYRGSYPENVLRAYIHNEEWYSAYISSYLEKDVRSIQSIGDMRDFRKLMYLLAANASQILNMSNLASDIGVSVSTIKRWISVLEASYVIFLLPPYYKNYGKRVVKSPKIYFYDTGLVAHLTGIKNRELYENGPMAGALFENYIVSEVLKNEKHRNINAELYYFRTSNGVEVDLIIDRQTTRDWIEIKKSSTYKVSMIKSVCNLIDNDDNKNDNGYLIYRGETLPKSGRVQVLRYSDYLLA